MKEAEILDIILRGLYEFRSTGSYVAPSYFIPELTFEDEKRMGRWFEDSGYAKMLLTQDGCRLKITSEGIMYCEDDSSSHPGTSITALTYIVNNNSPGSTIQVGIHGQVLYPNISDIQRQIDEIRTQLGTLTGISTNMVSEIGECLDEIAAKVEDRKPVPEFFWKWLGRVADGTSIAGAAELLRQVANA